MFEILARSDGTEKPTPLQYRPFRAGAAAPSRRPFGQMLRPAGSGRQILLEFHRGVEADDAGVEREVIGSEAGVVAVREGGRKSVVLGRSGSVSVGLGGGRIHKKTKT